LNPLTVSGDRHRAPIRDLDVEGRRANFEELALGLRDRELIEQGVGGGGGQEGVSQRLGRMGQVCLRIWNPGGLHQQTRLRDRARNLPRIDRNLARPDRMPLISLLRKEAKLESSRNAHDVEADRKSGKSRPT